MGEILLYGVVGDEFDKLDAKTIAPLIRAGSGPLTLRINSPGGYVMEGLAIVAAIRDYRGKVTAYVDGLAASMASVIAAACDECIMAEASMLMVHNPWDVVIGDAPALRAEADKLDRIRDQMVGIYGKRSGIGDAELIAMLDAETWMDAATAVERGFADRIAPDLKIAAMANVSAFGFRHPPEQLKETSVPEPIDTTQAVTLERTRISTIMALGTKHRLPETLTQDLISRGVELAQARAAILDHLAAEGDAANVGHNRPGGHDTLDDPAFRAKAMSDAIAARIQNKPVEGAGTVYRGMALIDIAKECLATSGVRDIYRMNNDRVATLAMQPTPFNPRAGLVITHTTSDFPDIMQTGIDAALSARYRTQESQLKRLTSARDVADFKDQTLVSAGAAGALDRVAEGAEFKNRTLETGAERYNLDTFGNLINFSRQMLINDSLGALSDIVRIMGDWAAETEAVLLAAAINSNIPMRSDGKPWFVADHGNIATQIGPPSIATLDAGRMSMRRRTQYTGGAPIDANPKFLVVPAELQTQAETLLASATIPATQTTGAGSSAVSVTTGNAVNPFAGKLEVISDPRLIDAAAWYLFADPEFAPAFLSIYLNGQREPFTDSREGFRVDGIEYKVRHDFNVGLVDYKLAWKNPGK